jgi:phosphoribosylformimino-5-aminoimidazole carboxamide ribotide isomerase
LNGAFDGQSTNAQAVRAILKAVSIPLQLGGGIRNRAHVENWLETGIARVILGTLALRNPPLVRELALAFPGKIVVGLDSNQGRVAVEGWAELSDMPARELACRFEDSGVAALIVTDISRDGTKTGVNVEFTQEIADAVTIPVIASGGVKSVADITALRASTGRQSITGTILGRALYDGDINPTQALKAASPP